MRYLTKKTYHLDDSDGEGSWAISYGDMITLLLSFFVIFFTTDLKKETAQKKQAFMNFSLQELREIPTEISKESQNSKSPIDADSFLDLDIQVREANDKIVISFGRYSFFNSGQVDVKDETVKILNKFAEKYLPHAGTHRLSIKGFTDTKKVSNPNLRRFKDNLELSALRSIAAMRVLQQAGLPLNRMEIAGAGELNDINRFIPDLLGLTKEERDNYSRTIILVISPERENAI